MAKAAAPIICFIQYWEKNAHGAHIKWAELSLPNGTRWRLEKRYLALRHGTPYESEDRQTFSPCAPVNALVPYRPLV